MNLNMHLTEINAYYLKIIAITAMAVDHIAWQFVPLDSVAGQVMHAVGRLTFPIMAFLLVEGYRHTRNLKRYGLRLLSFAGLSALPYGLNFGSPFNVLFTLFLGLIVICSIDKIMASCSVGADPHRIGGPKSKKLQGILLCILAAASGMYLANAWDWGATGILMIVAFNLSHGSRKRQLQSYGLLAAAVIILAFVPELHPAKYNPLEHSYLIGLLFPIPLLLSYNGRRGRDMRWFFYIFYPAHLLMIVFVRFLFFR